MATPAEDRLHLHDHVLCPRTSRLRIVAEHLACPYCWGRAGDVESGDRARFCDWDARADPLCYGFPDGSSRLRSG